MLEKYIKRFMSRIHNSLNRVMEPVQRRKPITEVQNTMKHFCRDTTYRDWKRTTLTN